MTIKEQGDAVTFEMKREDLGMIKEVLVWAMLEAVEDNDLAMARKIITLAGEMYINDTSFTAFRRQEAQLA